ncbi:MAG: carboxypeptidase regulatory-like domain-containing protein, partial [Phycisphaerae bacterium]
MPAAALATAVSLVAILGSLPAGAQPTPPTSPGNEWVVVGQVLDAAGAGIEGACVQVESGGDEKTEGRVLGRAASDRTGDFRIRLPGEPSGKLFVRVKKERFAVFFAPVEFEPGERETFVDVEMVGTLSVRGTVVAAETGRPIRDADVRIDIQDRRWEGRSDDRGRFALRGLPAGAGLLVVSRPGFGRQRQRIRVEPDTAEVQVRLAPERPVRVRLVNDRGEPLAEAEIEVEAGDDIFLATTDAEGRADLHGIGKDTTEIAWRARHPDGMRMANVANSLVLDEATATPETMPSASRPAVHTLILPRGGTVAGRVTDAVDGQPVNGARVVVVAGQGGTWIEWTGAEGNFEIAGVAPGRMTVAVQHPDYAPELLDDEARAGWKRRIPIRLSRGKPLAGVVVDEAGKPLDQVQVVCTRWRDRDVIGLRALTDEQGRFAFEHAPDGPIEFAFFRPGGGRLSGRILTAGNTDYRFTLEPAREPTTAESA